MDKQLTSLAEGFASLLRDSKYADLEIRCDGKIFSVHRAIVCSMSKVLAKECDGVFKEAGARVIEHDMFRASTLERMLQFMYGGNYTVGISSVASNATDMDDHCSMKNDETKDTAVNSDAAAPASLLVPSDEATAQLSTPMLSLDTEVAIAHIEVYALADYYDVPALKALALQNFGNSLRAVEPDEFVLVVGAVYCNTIKPDDSMRKSVLVQTLERIQVLLSRESFIRAVSEQSELQHFAAGVLQALYKEANSVNSEKQASIDILQAELITARQEAETATQQNEIFRASRDAKDEALKETACLTWKTSSCRNCSAQFGSYLDGEDIAARLDRACLLRCRSCRCKHTV